MAEQFWTHASSNARNIDTSRLRSAAFEDGQPFLWRRMGITRTKLSRMLIESYHKLKNKTEEPLDYDNSSESFTGASLEEEVIEEKTIPQEKGKTKPSSSGNSSSSNNIPTTTTTLTSTNSASTFGDNLHVAVRDQSSILSNDMAVVLASFLPEISPIDSFQLAYSADEHGWHLGTLYNKVESLYPCILILKAIKSKAVVGAFISTPISPPSNKVMLRINIYASKIIQFFIKYIINIRRTFICTTQEPVSIQVRGNGDTFCFRLDGIGKKYSWVGLDPARSRLNEDDTSLRMFSMCTNSCLLFGSSKKNSQNTLRIDDELNLCSFGCSDTFNPSSEPLISESEESSPFRIQSFEIFCGKYSMERKKR